MEIISEFKNWVEAVESRKRYVFMDLNETLLTKLEEGWLKDCPENNCYMSYMTAGEHPHPNVKTIRHEGRNVHIFPRTKYKEYLQQCGKSADIYILTHSDNNWADKSCAAVGITPLVKGIFTTRELAPNDLAKRFGLEKAEWVLVDNMGSNSIQICNKMRILGLNFPDAKNPRDEAQLITKLGRKHFVNIKDWWPTVSDNDDIELLKVLPEVKAKLGLRPY